MPPSGNWYGGQGISKTRNQWISTNATLAQVWLVILACVKQVGFIKELYIELLMWPLLAECVFNCSIYHIISTPGLLADPEATNVHSQGMMGKLRPIEYWSQLLSINYWRNCQYYPIEHNFCCYQLWMLNSTPWVSLPSENLSVVKLFLSFSNTKYTAAIHVPKNNFCNRIASFLPMCWSL